MTFNLSEKQSIIPFFIKTIYEFFLTFSYFCGLLHFRVCTCVCVYVCVYMCVRACVSVSGELVDRLDNRTVWTEVAVLPVWRTSWYRAQILSMNQSDQQLWTDLVLVSLRTIDLTNWRAHAVWASYRSRGFLIYTSVSCKRLPEPWNCPKAQNGTLYLKSWIPKVQDIYITINALRTIASPSQ